jgi:hypothetical protein
MQKAGQDLIPDEHGACEAFSEHVRSVQGAVVHTYQITAFAAVREQDPKRAAERWKEMVKFCDAALEATKTLKDRFPLCGTPQLYDLVLDYRSQAEKRFYQNLQDSECPSPPEGLFPKLI